MPKKKEKDKFYIVVSRDKNYTHGAFPHSEQGLNDAKKYAKKISSSLKEKFEIKVS